MHTAVNVKGALLAVLKGAAIFVLWVACSILSIVGALTLTYGALQIFSPKDPSIGDALAWMLLFAAPAWVAIGIMGGTAMTLRALALWAKRNAETAL